MQPGERERGLRLNDRRGHHLTPCCADFQVLEERRLADARLSSYDDGAALSAPERVERAIERTALTRTSDQRQVCIAVHRVPVRGGEHDPVRHASADINRPRELY